MTRIDAQITREQVIREINKGIEAARKEGVICGPVVDLRLTPPHSTVHGDEKMTESHVMTCLTGKNSRVVILSDGGWGPRQIGNLIRHLELTRDHLVEDERAALPPVPVIKDPSPLPA